MGCKEWGEAGVEEDEMTARTLVRDQIWIKLVDNLWDELKEALHEFT